MRQNQEYFDDKQKTLINAWISQAAETSNEYLKFMSNWIAFNAICYNLFFEQAVKDRVEINSKKSKLLRIKESFKQKAEIQAHGTSITLKKEKIEININEPERLNLSIKEKYTEDLIYVQFVKSYSDKIIVDDELFQSLKESLNKESRFYVINMARIKAFNEVEDIDSQSKANILVLCETNNLKTIKNVLYQIRCNIFHGEKIPGDPNDDRIVKSANPILNQITKYLIDEQGIK
ncbi:MAG: hypothetical protein P8O87_09300 [Crocinitomicaceae bacterium]|nr:hypothetical protein [Crocinitomicaceae bacterium]